LNGGLDPLFLNFIILLLACDPLVLVRGVLTASCRGLIIFLTPFLLDFCAIAPNVTWWCLFLVSFVLGFYFG
jgi:hypothetical protein